MKTHALVSPKGMGTKINLDRDLDKGPSTAALISPKYTKKPVLSAAGSTKPISRLIDASVSYGNCITFIAD